MSKPSKAKLQNLRIVSVSYKFLLYLQLIFVRTLACLFKRKIRDSRELGKNIQLHSAEAVSTHLNHI